MKTVVRNAIVAGACALLAGVVQAGSGVSLTEWAVGQAEKRPAFPRSYLRTPAKFAQFERNAETFAEEDALARLHLRLTENDRLSWKVTVEKAAERIAIAELAREQGVSWTFAVYTQLRNAVPYYWLGAGYSAYAGEDALNEAVRRVRRILCGEKGTCRLSFATEKLVRSEVSLRVCGGDNVEIPFDRAYFLFIDDKPGANWQHPCRYVFFNESLTEFAVSYRMDTPEIVRIASGEAVSLKSADAEEPPPVSLEQVKNAVYSAARQMESNGISYDGDASRSYFVLLSGGQKPQKNGIRFWADTAMFYSTLRKQYKVPADHIWVYMSDGTSTGKDANLASTNDGVTPVLVDSPKDLDGDGYSDINGPATKSNFQTVLSSTLKAKLTSSDQLFVFITTHGGPDGTAGPYNYDCTACLFNDAGDAEFTDDELQSWTKDIKCPIAFAIGSCYSGGFIDDLKKSSNRAIATACNNNESSIGANSGGTWGSSGAGQTKAFNYWVMPLNAAFRGYWPAVVANVSSATFQHAYPWSSGSSCSADENDDGKVSFREAMQFAANNDLASSARMTGGEHPQYAESTSGLGDTFFILQEGEEEEEEEGEEGYFGYRIRKNDDGSRYAQLTYYFGEEKSVTVPGTLGGYPVEEIDEYAFEEQPVETVILPKSCTAIYPYAFCACPALKQVTFTCTDDTVLLFDLSFDDCPNVTVKVNGTVYFASEEILGVLLGEDELEGPYEGTELMFSIVRDGYTLDGWYTDFDGKGLKIDVSKPWQTADGVVISHWISGGSSTELVFGPGKSSTFSADGGTAHLVGASNVTWDKFSNSDYVYKTKCFYNLQIVDAEKDGAANNDDFWCGAMSEMDMMFMQGWVPAAYKSVDDIVAKFDKKGSNGIRWAKSQPPTKYTEVVEGEYGYRDDETYYKGMFRWLKDKEGVDVLPFVSTGSVGSDFPNVLKQAVSEGKVLQLGVDFPSSNTHQFWSGLSVRHFVVCCGYIGDDSISGASALKALFIIDPDNDQYNAGGGATAPNSILYCPVSWTGSKYAITGVWGSSGSIAGSYVALAKNPGVIDSTKVETPVLDPPSNMVFTAESLAVKCTCATAGAEIHFTTNGDAVAKGSEKWPDAGLVLTDTTTVKVRAYKDGLTESDEVSVTYTYSDPGGTGKRALDPVVAVGKKDRTEAAAAATYTGWLHDASGNLTGSFTMKVGKANKGFAKVTLTVTDQSGQKKKYTGNYDVSDGKIASGDLEDLAIGEDGVVGTVGSGKTKATLTGARNAPKEADQAKVFDTVFKGKVFTFAFTGKSKSISGSAAFSVKFSAKGKAKISGTLMDGSKVSTSAQLVLGDGKVCALPIAFSKKNKASFGLVLWFSEKAVFKEATSIKTCRMSDGSTSVSVAFEDCAAVSGTSAPKAKQLLVSEKKVATISMNGTKWVATGEEATAKPKLSYAVKTGLFTGSYKATDKGVAKPVTAKITGAWLGNHGVGTASAKVNKETKTWPVEVK